MHANFDVRRLFRLVAYCEKDEHPRTVRLYVYSSMRHLETILFRELRARGLWLERLQIRAPKIVTCELCHRVRFAWQCRPFDDGADDFVFDLGSHVACWTCRPEVFDDVLSERGRDAMTSFVALR